MEVSSVSGNVFRVPLAELFGKIELNGTGEGSQLYVFLVENEMGGKKYTVPRSLLAEIPVQLLNLIFVIMVPDFGGNCEINMKTLSDQISSIYTTFAAQSLYDPGSYMQIICCPMVGGLPLIQIPTKLQLGYARHMGCKDCINVLEAQRAPHQIVVIFHLSLSPKPSTVWLNDVATTDDARSRVVKQWNMLIWRYRLYPILNISRSVL